MTITVGNPDVGLPLAASGFDFLWFEMEHTPPTLESVHNMILATRGLKTVPLIRVPWNEPWLVKRALDAGGLGVIFPFTNTRALAEQAVRACKYPPLGVRGFGPDRALLHWNQDTDNYTGISILSFPFTRKPMPATLSCQPQTALASLR